VVVPEPVPGGFPGAPPPLVGNALVDWITGSPWPGRTITSAIPPTYAHHATVVVPAEDGARTRADAALVGVLRALTRPRPWWLGYLDTGVADVVHPDAPRVAVYGWPYVLLDGGPEQALSARRNQDGTPWHSALPELVFPRDRSWLVATRWDDDWRCVGGPPALVDALLEHPDLRARAVLVDDDDTPPGHGQG